MAIRLTNRLTAVPGLRTTLEQVQRGARVRVVALDEHGDHDDCRLREMGLYEGAEAEVRSIGDPVVISLLDSRVAMCRRCAHAVTVDVCEASSPL